jgi:hypothetical protein
MSTPVQYIERRVETLDLADDYHLEARVTQQFTVPQHTHKKGEAKSARNLLVPIGWYPKDRLPDLTVVGHDGAVLPLLRRRDQGRVAATLFTVRWHDTFLGHLSEATRSEAKLTWEVIKAAVEQIVTSSRLGANLVMYRLRRYLEELSAATNDKASDLKCFLLAVLAKGDFWTHLQVLAGVRLLVARMRGTPTRTYVVRVSYTERFEYHNYSRDGTLWRVLEWLGLVYIPIRRPAANIGHAASLWIIYSTPDGIEPLRCFWLSQVGQPTHEDVTVAVRKVAVGRHAESQGALKPDAVDLDVQMEATSAVAATAALAGILFLMSVFVYKAGPHGLNVGGVIPVVGLFAAAPPTLSAAFAYRSTPFSRYVNRGPRALLSGLAALGSVFAVVIGFHGTRGFAEPLSYVVAVYSAAVAMLFLLIFWAPRWRRNERSRRIRVTERTAPKECRRLQGRDTVGLSGVATVLLVGIARTLTVLQHYHIFLSHFPRDIFW